MHSIFQQISPLNSRLADFFRHFIQEVESKNGNEVVYSLTAKSTVGLFSEFNQQLEETLAEALINAQKYSAKQTLLILQFYMQNRCHRCSFAVRFREGASCVGIFLSSSVGGKLPQLG